MNDQSQKAMMNQPQPQMMMNRNYGVWPPPPLPDDRIKFQSQPRPVFAVPKHGRNNWKGKKNRRMDKALALNGISSGSGTGSGSGSGKNVGGGGGGGYKPPTLHELQSQNRMKAKRFYSKKKFNRVAAPFAPRNTTSFIIRAKKSGGIASLISPCPVTPAVLPTPIFSPSREVLGDMAKEEWGVDGYGSMNGLIRLRSPGQEMNDEEDEEGGGSSESDVEEHVEVERRLDHDLSRFEMIYPNCGDENANLLLENQVGGDQDAHIAHLEEENLTLKERLYLMERELIDLRTRLQCLESESQANKGNNKEPLENKIEVEGNDDREEDAELQVNNNIIIDEEVSDGGSGDVCSDKSIGDGGD